MLELNKDNFEKEVLQSDKPVIVDYFATWCGPCMNLAPIFEEISKELGDKIKFAKVNVEENQDLAGEHQVRGIPCMIIFNKGEEAERIVGFSEKEALKEKIEEVLKGL